jgi:plastocyanin
VNLNVTRTWRARALSIPFFLVILDVFKPRFFSTLVALLLYSAPALADQSEAAAKGGSISGIVLYHGAAPKAAQLEVSKDRDVCGAHTLFDQSLVVGKDGGLANAVVSLPDLDRGKPVQPAKVIFDQRGCEYVPHVIAFPAGSTVEILNSDGILHNIHTESSINPVIDMAQPGFKKSIRVAITKPEAIKVTCDAHNWMEGWWYVTSNSYYAVTDAHGHYTIRNVPPGTHKMQVWQEKLGTQTRDVTINPGATTVADFTFAPVAK